MSGFFSNRDETINLEPILTPEQQQALSLLLQFGSTGQIGDFQAGQAADLSGFNFDLSPTEVGAESALLNLLGSTSGLGEARDLFRGFANERFDLDDPSTGIASFRRQVARGTKDADDVINREAAITGDRFGSRIQNTKRDLALRQSDAISGEIARQYENTQARRFGATQGLANLAGLENQIQQSRIAQAFGFGGARRDLQNQQAQLQLDDFIRQRNERLDSIGALNTVFNRSVPYGQTSSTIKRPSVFQALLGEISPILGSYNTQVYGGNVPNQSSIGEGFQALLSILQAGV